MFYTYHNLSLKYKKIFKDEKVEISPGIITGGNENKQCFILTVHNKSYNIPYSDWHQQDELDKYIMKYVKNHWSELLV